MSFCKITIMGELASSLSAIRPTFSFLHDNKRQYCAPRALCVSSARAPSDSRHAAGRICRFYAIISSVGLPLVFIVM